MCCKTVSCHGPFCRRSFAASTRSRRSTRCGSSTWPMPATATYIRFCCSIRATPALLPRIQAASRARCLKNALRLRRRHYLRNMESAWKRSRLDGEAICSGRSSRHASRAAGIRSGWPDEPRQEAAAAGHETGRRSKISPASVNLRSSAINGRDPPRLVFAKSCLIPQLRAIQTPSRRPSSQVTSRRLQASCGGPLCLARRFTPSAAERAWITGCRARSLASRFRWLL